LDASFIPGQSGGAIFNMRGEVVSIVQRGTSGLGLGVGVEIIMSKVGRYFTGGK
jgi:S1-C subfamily serine protease